MRAAPPVEFTSAPGRLLRGALAVLAGAVVAVPLAWGLPYFAAHWGSLSPDPAFALLADGRVQAGLAAGAGLMAAAAFLSARIVGGSGPVLRWDGQDWALAAQPGAAGLRGTARLMLDLGPWLLVRFVSDSGGATWLPFHVAGDLARWASLRGALWSWRQHP